MVGYREIWDDENNKFIMQEFELKHKYDFDSIPESNLTDTMNGYNEHKEIVEEHITRDNEKLANGEFHVLKCKDCSKFFILPEDEITWFKQRDMVPPKRCPFCRSKRKQNKV